MKGEDMSDKKTGLDLLREPFPANMISKLPKPTKAQTDAVRNDFKAGIRCDVCGGWHHPKVVHLDYVGHAALTDRLLDCDPKWNWEPVAFTDAGTPATDANGGMWIRLTVCGVTRLGYGNADGKKGGDAVKELIGDALRNAAMRFGAALDLWHKGDLHADDAPEEKDGGKDPSKPPATINDTQYINLRDMIEEAGVTEQDVLKRVGAPSLEEFPLNRYAATVKGLEAKIAKDKAAKAKELIGDDEIPYEGANQ